jgi:hypothetical protein
MKIYWGNGGIAPRILNLGTRWRMEVGGELHAPTALSPEKKLLYPLDRRLGGPQSRSGCGGEEKISLSQNPVVQPVAY